jgi:hypothetical protein
MRLLFAIAAIWIGSTLPARAEPEATVKARLEAVARDQARTAAVGATSSWSRDGATGSALFMDWSDACRAFVIMQTSPPPSISFIGRACIEASGAVSITNMTKQDAPGSSSGATRGIRPRPQSAPEAKTKSLPTPAPSSPSPPSAPTAGDTPDIDVKAVLVELPRVAERENRNGGHAVIVLSRAATARNLVTCEAFAKYFDDSDMESVRVGLERRADGGFNALRPVYWPIDERIVATSATRCGRRLERYNFIRAQTIRDKLGLTTEGPHLVVSRGDEQVAATLDLSGLSNARVDEAVRFFRDGFSQETQAWDAEVYSVALRERRARETVGGGDVGAQILAILAFVSRPGVSVGAGCPRGDLSDCAR